MMRHHLSSDLPEAEDLLARPELGLVAPLRAHVRLVQEMLAAPRALGAAEEDAQLLDGRLRELAIQHMGLLEHVLASYQEALERVAAERARERSARARVEQRLNAAESDGPSR